MYIRGKLRSASAKRIALLAAAALVPVFPATASAGANDGPQCSNGNLCVWSDVDYGGSFKGEYPDSLAGNWVAGEFPMYSAKNKFGNRRVQLQAWNTPWIRCLDPGEVDPDMVMMRSFKIGAPGSRC